MNKADIKEIFIANGFTIKEGQTDLKDYVYKAAYSLIEAAIGEVKIPVPSLKGTFSHDYLHASHQTQCEVIADIGDKYLIRYYDSLFEEYDKILIEKNKVTLAA